MIRESIGNLRTWVLICNDTKSLIGAMVHKLKKFMGALSESILSFNDKKPIFNQITSFYSRSKILHSRALLGISMMGTRFLISN